MQAFLLLLVLLVGLYASRAHTLHPALCRLAAWAAPRWTPYSVVIEHLEGDWVSGLTIRGLRVAAHEEGTPLEELELEEVEVRARFLDWLRGDAEALELVRAARGGLRLHVPESEEPSEPVQLPEHWPALVGEDLDVEVVLASGRSLAVEGLSVEPIDGPGRSHRLACRRAVLSRPEGEPFEVALAIAVAWDGAELAFGELVCDGAPIDASARLAGEQLDFALRLAGVDLERVAAELPPEWEAVQGMLDLELEGSLPLAEPLEARARLEARVHGLVARERRLDELELSAEIEDGRLLISGGRVVLPGGNATLSGGSVDLFEPDTPFAVDLSLDFQDLGPLGVLLGDAEPWSGMLGGKARFDGDARAFVGTGTLSGADVHVGGVDLGRVSFQVRADGETVRLTDLAVRSETTSIEGSGTWRFEERSFEGVRLTGTLSALERHTEGLAPGASVELELELEGPLAAPDGRIAAKGRGLVIQGWALSDAVLSGTITAGVLAADTLSASGPFGTLRAALDVTLPRLDPSAAGEADAERELAFLLRALELDVEGTRLELEAPATIELLEGGIAIDELTLVEPEGGGARLDLEVAWSSPEAPGAPGASTRVRLVASELPATELLGPFWSGSALAKMHASGVDADLSVALVGGDLDVDGSLHVARFSTAEGTEPLELDISGRLKDGRLELARTRARAADEVLADLSASFPCDPVGETLLPEGAVEIRGTFVLPSERELRVAFGGSERSLTGDVDGRVELGGTWRHLTGTVSLDAHQVRVDPPLDPFLVEPSRVSFEARLGDELEVLRLDLDLPRRAALESSGRVESTVDVAALVDQGLAAWGAAPLELTGKVSLAEIAWVSRLSRSVRRIGGSVDGTFSVDGTIAEPRPRLQLAVRDGAVKVGDTPEMSEVVAEITYEDRVFTLERLTGQLGSSPLEVEGRLAVVEDGLDADVTLRGENVLLSRTPNARLRGDLDLRLTGTRDHLRLAGEIRLRHSTVLQDIDLLAGLVNRGGYTSGRRGLVLPSFTDGSLATTSLDVRVVTAEPMNVRTNLARGEATVDLHIGGTGAVIVPTGRIFLDGLRVQLPSGPVQFDSGLVTFQPQRPHVPRLDLVGSARLSGYDVQLTVTGPYDDLEVVGSSQPPLSTNDLYLLIIAGRLPLEGERVAATVQSLGIYVARDLLQRWSGGPDAEDSYLDRIEILSGREVSKAGVMTMEVSYRVLDDPDPSGETLMLVAERDRFEDINMGLRLVLRSR